MTERVVTEPVIPEDLVEKVAEVIYECERGGSRFRETAHATIAAVLAYEQTCPTCGPGGSRGCGFSWVDGRKIPCSACGGSGSGGPRYLDRETLEEAGFRWKHEGDQLELHIYREPVFRLPGKQTP